jgi:hypothetical protein
VAALTKLVETCGSVQPDADRLEAEYLRRGRRAVEGLALYGVPVVVIGAVRDAIDASLSRLERRAVVFRPKCRAFGRGTWAIHWADEPEAVYACNLAGLTAGWLAIADRGLTNTVRAADFAAPGALRADVVVRKAIRVTAADWVERHTPCRPLAAALKAVQVVGGRVTYTRPAGTLKIITDV